MADTKYKFDVEAVINPKLGKLKLSDIKGQLDKVGAGLDLPVNLTFGNLSDVVTVFQELETLAKNIGKHSIKFKAQPAAKKAPTKETPQSKKVEETQRAATIKGGTQLVDNLHKVALAQRKASTFADNLTASSTKLSNSFSGLKISSNAATGIKNLTNALKNFTSAANAGKRAAEVFTKPRTTPPAGGGAPPSGGKPPGGGGRRGGGRGAPEDFSIARLIDLEAIASSLVTAREQTSPTATRDILGVAKSIIEKAKAAETIGKRGPEENIEALSKKLQGASKSVGLEKAARLRKVLASVSENAGASIAELREVFNEIKVDLVAVGKRKKGQVGIEDTLKDIDNSLFTFQSRLEGNIRLNVDRNLVSKAEGLEKAFAKLPKAKINEKAIRDFNSALQVEVTNLVKGLDRSLTGAGAIESPYLDKEGVPISPLLPAFVIQDPNLQRTPEQRDRRQRIQKKLRGIEDPFSTEGQDAVVSVFKVMSEVLTGSAKDAENARKALVDFRNMLGATADQTKVQTLALGLFGQAVNRLTKGQLPTTGLTVKQQARLVGGMGRESSVKGFSAASKVVAENLKQFGGRVDTAALLFDKLRDSSKTVDEFRTNLAQMIVILKQVRGATPAEEGARKLDIARLGKAGKELDAPALAGTDVGAIKSAVLVGARAFDKMSQDAYEIATTMGKVDDPVERARTIFDRMFNEAQGDVNNLGKSFSKIINDLNRVKGIAGVKETLSELKKIQKDISGLGEGKAPKALSQTQQFRAIRSQVASAEKALKPGEKKVLTYQVKDATGPGFKSLRVSLRRAQRGAKAVRASFKELPTAAEKSAQGMQMAFRRVAVWGTAAGITYGAIRAFREAIKVMTEVEVGVIKIGKVMNAATANFSAFQDEVLKTASAITTKFGVAIEDVLDTMFTFAQQGLEMPEVAALAETTGLAANVSNLSGPQAAEALTAAFRQFNMEAQDSTKILDSWNEVANNFAVQEDIMADALKKSGVAARNAGVTFDEFNGIVAAVGSATRQKGKEIGTSLKFIFQRIGRPVAAKALKEVGVAVTDAAGNFRGFMNIIKDLDDIWAELTQTQRLHISQAVAGIRQYNAFLTVMDEFGVATEAIDTSVNSQGSALRENAKVMESTSKQWAVLIEKVKEAAVGLGSVFLPAAKGVIGVLGGFASALNALPTSLKAVVGGFALIGVASLKAADKVDMLLTGLMSIPAGAGGIGTAIRAAGANIGAGAAIDTLSLAKQAELNKEGAEVARAAARTGDFTKGGLRETIKKAGPKFAPIAVDSKRIRLATNNMTKFDAAVRAVTLGAGGATLGVKDMNSIFSKLGLTIARIGQRGFATLFTAIANLGAGLVNLATSGKTAAEGMKTFSRASITAGIASKGFLVSLGALGAVIAAVSAAVYGLSKAYDVVFGRGTDAIDATKKHTAAMQEQFEVAKKGSGAYKSLKREREALAKAEKDVAKGEGPRLKAEGRFEPPTLLKLGVADKEARLLNSLGAGALDAVKGFDEFGNVLLKNDSILDDYSASAEEAAATNVAFAKTTAAVAAAQEILDKRWFKWTNAAEQLEEASSKLKEFVKRFSDLNKLATGLNLSSLDGVSERFTELQQENIKATAEFDMYAGKLIEFTSNLPKSTGQSFFQGLAVDPKLEGILDGLAKVASRKLEPAFGAAIGRVEALNKIFVATRTGLKEVSDVGDVTLAKFEKRGLVPLEVDSSNVDEAVEKIRKSATSFNQSAAVLSTPGAKFLKNVLLTITDEGDVVVEQLDKFGNKVKSTLDEITQKGRTLQIIEKGSVARQVQDEIDAIKKIVTGFAAGTIFKGEIKLGARLSFDLTPQQKVARDLPKLFKAATVAQTAYDKALKESKKQIEKAGFVSAETAKHLDNLASKLNFHATLVRLASDIQAIGSESEKTSKKIQDAKISRELDIFFASFRKGAEKGLVSGLKFEGVKPSTELSDSQKFAKEFGSQISDFMAQEEEAKALIEVSKGFEKLQPDFAKIIAEFERTSGELGADVDFDVLAANLLKSKSVGEAVDKTVRAKEIRTQEDQLKTLQNIDQNIAEDTKKQSLQEKNAAVKAFKPPTEEKVLENTIVKFTKSLKELAPTKDITKDDRDIDKGFFDSIVDSASSLFSDADKKAEKDEVSKISEVSNLSKFISESINKVAKESVASGKAPTDEEVAKVIADTGDRTNKALEVWRKELVDATIKTAVSPETFWAADKRTDRADPEVIGAQIKALEESKKTQPAAIKATLESTIKGLKAAEEANQKKIKVEEKNTEKAAKLSKAFQSLAARLGDVSKSNAAARLSILESTRLRYTALQSLGKFKDALENGSISIRKALSAKNLLRGLSTPLAGALKGVTSISPKGIGKEQFELSPLERLSKDFPSLMQNFDDFQSTVIPGNITQLQTLSKEIERQEQIVSDLRKGGNKEDAKVYQNTLDIQKQVRDKFRQNIIDMRDGLSPLADSIRKLSVIETARKNIEDLVASLAKFEATRYDTSSLDKALGASPFSITTPKLGQSRDLDQFQRREEELQRRRATAQTPEEKKAIDRQLEEVKFDREEAKIGVKQKLEDERLSKQRQVGESALSELVDLQRKGTNVQPLIDEIKRRLEAAGQTIEGAGGRGSQGGLRGFREGGRVALRRGVDISDLSGQLKALRDQAEKQAHEQDFGTLEDLNKQQVEQLKLAVKALQEQDKEIKDSTKGIPKAGSFGENVAEGLKSIFAEDATQNAIKDNTEKTASILDTLKDIFGTFVTDLAEAITTPFFKAFDNLKSIFGGKDDQKKYSGGMVSGPGGRDAVSAKLTAGEFVLPTKAVSSLVSTHGSGILGALRKGSLPGFAGGGPVRSSGKFLEELLKEGSAQYSLSARERDLSRRRGVRSKRAKGLDLVDPTFKETSVKKDEYFESYRKFLLYSKASPEDIDELFQARYGAVETVGPVHEFPSSGDRYFTESKGPSKGVPTRNVGFNLQQLYSKLPGYTAGTDRYVKSRDADIKARREKEGIFEADPMDFYYSKDGVPVIEGKPLNLSLGDAPKKKRRARRRRKKSSLLEDTRRQEARTATGLLSFEGKKETYAEDPNFKRDLDKALRIIAEAEEKARKRYAGVFDEEFFVGGGTGGLKIPKGFARGGLIKQIIDEELPPDLQDPKMLGMDFSDTNNPFMEIPKSRRARSTSIMDPSRVSSIETPLSRALSGGGIGGGIKGLPVTLPKEFQRIRGGARDLLTNVPQSVSIDVPTHVEFMSPSYLFRYIKGELKKKGYAGGGAISGPGGPRADLVPIMASDGEFVLNAKAVDSIGLSRLEYMNKRGNVPNFADGGIIGKAKSGETIPVSLDEVSSDISKEISTAIKEAFSAGAESIKEAIGDGPTLQLPDNIEQLLTVKVDDVNVAAGGPGARRVDAMEGSVDILREKLSELEKELNDTSSTLSNTISMEDVDRVVDTKVKFFEGEIDTKLNERFSNTTETLRAEVDTKISKNTLETSAQIADGKNLATQALTAAQSAMARALAR
jgi:TP901 family phage tail tape measure protein